MICLSVVLQLITFRFWMYASIYLLYLLNPFWGYRVVGVYPSHCWVKSYAPLMNCPIFTPQDSEAHFWTTGGNWSTRRTCQLHTVKSQPRFGPGPSHCEAKLPTTTPRCSQWVWLHNNLISARTVVYGVYLNWSIAVLSSLTVPDFCNYCELLPM